MSGPRPTRPRAPWFLAGGAMLAILVAGTTAARAQAFVAPPAPGAGYYYPGPYYGYPPPDPYAYGAGTQYYAPPAYYPPVTSGSPAPVEATPLPAPIAAAPLPAPAPADVAPPRTVTATAAPGFGYTAKPAFINASGQTCREYRATDLRSGRPVEVYGTACREPDGQWRVVN